MCSRLMDEIACVGGGGEKVPFSNGKKSKRKVEKREHENVESANTGYAIDDNFMISTRR